MYVKILTDCDLFSRTLVNSTYRHLWGILKEALRRLARRGRINSSGRKPLKAKRLLDIFCALCPLLSVWISARCCRKYPRAGDKLISTRQHPTSELEAALHAASRTSNHRTPLQVERVSCCARYTDVTRKNWQKNCRLCRCYRGQQRMTIRVRAISTFCMYRHIQR